jgi:hypothetical protein
MITNELMKMGTEKHYTHTYTVCNMYFLKVNNYKSSDYVTYLGYEVCSKKDRTFALKILLLI